MRAILVLGMFLELNGLLLDGTMIGKVITLL
jgi:hypothetical protein